MSRSLIIHGGPILTMDDANPIVDAGIDNGIVVATGTDRSPRADAPLAPNRSISTAGWRRRGSMTPMRTR